MSTPIAKDTPVGDHARFVATDLIVPKKQDAPAATFTTGPGLTLIHNERENYATALSLALAGRMNTAEGSIELETPHGTYNTPRTRFTHVALAGAAEIDSLERQVPSREIVREQIAWQSSALSRTPRRAFEDERYVRWAEPMGLDIDPATAPGELNVLDRLRLRVVLAMISRPEADIVIVDDIDQLKSITARAALLKNLKTLSSQLPVVAHSVNAEHGGVATSVVKLSGMGV